MATKRKSGMNIDGAFGGGHGWAEAMRPPTDAEIKKNSWIPRLSDIENGIKKRRS